MTLLLSESNFKSLSTCVFFLPSKFGCLIIEFHSFIQFTFDKFTAVSCLGHKFDMLIWISLSWVFFLTFFTLSIFWSIYCYCIFFLYYLN